MSTHTNNPRSLKRPNDTSETDRIGNKLLQARLNTDKATRPGTIIWHLNIGGLWSKIEYIKHAISSSTHIPDIIAICETKVQENGQPPSLPEYKHFYNNFTKGSSGTAIYYRMYMKAE